MKTCQSKIVPLLTIYFLFVASAFAQSVEIPEKPDPPRLVNDFTGTLSSTEISKLEQKLVAFNDSTSTQIAVVLVTSLGDYDKAQFADLLGEKWGIGRKGKNNGLVVLVKPKQGTSSGEAFIATGYGLDGAVPDAVVKRILEEEMFPSFRENRYFEGLDRATDILMNLTAGEYSAEEYLKTPPPVGVLIGALFPFLIFVLMIILFSRKNKMTNYGGRSSNMPLWTALFLASQLGQQKGKWGSFTSGGGSFGGGSGSFGGGGGFGGFGGGSFGGGGAGGSW
ncbi:MAG: TPM domain-containing protein [Bacteroidales bacterium]|nr:TPM domain-containing protein [Bacteroidales bacterium]